MKPLYKYLLVGIACFLLALLVPKCGGPRDVEDSSPLKAKTQQDIKKGDSLKVEAAKADTVSKKEVKKWRAAKSNPKKLPCDTLLPQLVSICDTVIIKDSTEITALKKVITQQDTIIKDYQSLVKNDSLQITGLKKEVRKERFWKKFFQVTTGAALIFGVVK